MVNWAGVEAVQSPRSHSALAHPPGQVKRTESEDNLEATVKYKVPPNTSTNSIILDLGTVPRENSFFPQATPLSAWKINHTL